MKTKSYAEMKNLLTKSEKELEGLTDSINALEFIAQVADNLTPYYFDTLNNLRLRRVKLNKTIKKCNGYFENYTLESF